MASAGMVTPTKTPADDAAREDGGSASASTTPLSSSAAVTAPSSASSALGNVRLSGRKIKELFFTQVSSADAEELTRFQCRCGKVRVQSLRHGYTNLKQHVLVKHRDWLIECADEVAVTPPSSPRRARKPQSAGKSKLPPQKEDKALKKRRTSAMSSLSNGSGGDDASVRDDEQDDGSRADPGQDVPYDDQDEGSTEEDQEYAPQQSRQSIASTDSATVTKRQDYISWDDYFMSVAFLSAMRSKDPSTQVGACIVNKEKKIVGIGYNGFPNGCSDDELPWARHHENPLETKYPFVCHAEMNAILNKNSSDLKGCTIYVALFPCNECAKLIIQCGIENIVYYSDKYHSDWKFVASRKLLDMAGVKYRRHRLAKTSLTIDFKSVL
ncbi:hypothetical protein P43SY_009565 [Pythium insidiosum]|uniref:dCMP deaminase n=1 Tax=Pythium insidiosum TaxID=114742 RepID=A0AAD5LMC3_PYTIN|nr:hypothetical protein P43SY_009565 [Pythium insidiosum]